MRTYERRYRLSGNSGGYQVRAPGIVGKVLTFAAGAVLLVVGFVFSLVVLAVAAAGAALLLGYLWWRSRDLRRQMREHPPGGRVIEGEVISDK